MQGFVPARCVRGAVHADVPIYSLPLPQYFVNPEEKPEDFVPRQFYHCSAVPGYNQPSSYHPRCGLSGLFFSREEVVDNLQAASTDLGYKSPYWISAQHPGLTSGFLRVRDGSESICISLTANVVASSDVEAGVPLRLDRTNRCTWDNKQGSPTGIPSGMNAITGTVSKNPFILKLPDSGSWLTEEQVQQHNLTLRKGTTYTLVEIDQWELLNADQLVVPGRLGLKKCIDLKCSDSIFSSA